MYATETGQSGMIYIWSVIEIGSAIEKLTEWDKYTETHGYTDSKYTLQAYCFFFK
jgi:hypothetical protein